MIHIGDWVAGDTGTKLIYQLKNPDGTAFDLTGAATALFHARSGASADAAVSVAATITNPPTLGQLEVLPVGTLIALGTRARIDLQCNFSWVKAGLLYYSIGFFKIGIVAFP